MTTYPINLGGECLYRNPFARERLTDDEVAILRCLLGMKEYLLTGNSFYSFAEGCQDNYFFLLMQEALKQPHVAVKTEVQLWN